MFPPRTIVAKIEIFLLRYYANAILDSIHKEVAIREWTTLARDVLPVLRHSPGQLSSRDLNRVTERSLAAFDLFILHDQPGDMDEVGLNHPCVCRSSRLPTYTVYPSLFLWHSDQHLDLDYAGRHC